MRHTIRFLVSAAVVLVLTATALAQLGELISPGPLARAHAEIDGAGNCDKCHEQGKRVSATRCLACHKAVAARIAQKKGVHRDVTTDCVACHVEHAGRDAELRPFDPKSFHHAVETGFPLEGRHAIDCVRCHRTRSYLGLSPQCVSCHKDAHAGRLGTDCARCHPTSAPFRSAAQQFDHARTAFPLEGAHRTVPCAKCHVAGRYAGVPHASCVDCHRNPHKTSVGETCNSCHTPANWKVANFDHARTGTPLQGRHRTVACARCHTKPATAVRLKMEPCGGCHADPHRGEFRQDCGACHNQSGFRGAPFDHSKTRFALAGRHRALACTQCHRKGTAAAPDFRGLSTQCVSCHKDPHNAQLGTSCERCHTAESFRVARYDHLRFPEFFGGQHASVVCDRCHRGAVQQRVYKNLSTDCASCHRDVHAGQFPRCADCHTVDAPKFAPSLFDHAKTSFPLTGRHASVQCRQCHKGETAVYRGTATACAACHADPHRGQLQTNCGGCHSTSSFRVEKYQHRNPGTFFRGRHAAAQCGDCHKKTEGMVRFVGVGPDCVSCHPDPHGGQLGSQCQNCHRVDAAWSNASRGFHKAGLFPLEGRHLSTPCADCHRDGVIKGTPTRCYDCHWVRRQDDRYRTRLGNECEECHRPTAWVNVSWDHGARTTFALSGAHASLACDQCHRGEFGAALSDCASCHAPDYQAAQEPNHASAGFPMVCQLCHRPADTSWHQARFAHSSFALAGVHQSQGCASCHRNNVYAGTPRDCVGCHRDDYDRSADPSHAAAGFTTACDTCHQYVDAQWSLGRYPHTAWPLAGRHANARCATCHANGVYAGRATDCASCHKADYDRAASPNHVAAGFPLTCDTCHRVIDPDWKQGRFEHETFGLAGVHATQSCSACHATGVYAGTPRTCAGCHQAAYNAARAPNHIAAGFATTCDTCHKYTDTTWQLGVFDHGIFALAGVHATQGCAACHANDVFAGTPRTCSGCHLSAYNTAQAPNHVAAGFPTTCDTCHKFTDATWRQGLFNHSTFTLAGVHATQVCGACHVNNVYAGTPRTCVGCHLSAFNTAQTPNHVAAGFPTTCDTCHKFTDATWRQGLFNHSTFTLAGVHATQVCSACHANNVYAGTPRTCVGCHQADFNAARDPNHVTAGFPTTCDTCHRFTDATWRQAVFTHATFPLAGVHATQTCTACHLNGVYAGTPRTCVGCHQAAYNATRDPNHVTAGFPTTCDTCHRFSDTRWDQGIFTHSTYRLLGVHVNQPCGACHKNGVYAGTPTTCVGCHLANYNATRDPNHIAAGFPTTCETCHRASHTSWQQGVFNHTWFPITTGRHAGNPCSACHPTPTAYSVFSCTTNCHSRSETDGHHREVSGYRYDSAACYACHPQGRAD